MKLQGNCNVLRSGFAWGNVEIHLQDLTCGRICFEDLAGFPLTISLCSL
jgi:hypothetical protein